MSNKLMPTKFELDAFHRNVSDEELIADLLRVSNELGRARVTFREYNAKGKFHSTTISTRFGSWNDALIKAGLEKTFERNAPNEALFKNLVDVWTKLGKQPKSRDLSFDISEYSSTTYANRFGSWRNALLEFVKWANENEIPVESRDHVERRKTPRNVNWRLRAQVLMRDGARCRLCGATPSSGANLHVDHVHPWAKGGETVLSNLQILCETCNIGKADLTE